VKVKTTCYAGHVVSRLVFVFSLEVQRFFNFMACVCVCVFIVVFEGFKVATCRLSNVT
jgi:hypothetical protein